VIAGEDEYIDVHEVRRVSRLPTGEPRDHVLESTQAAWRFCQLTLPLGDSGGGGGISGRQVEARRPQARERGEPSRAGAASVGMRGARAHETSW
jgi:hypothetical protein